MSTDPNKPCPFRLLCLGSGKSSFFFSSLTPPATEVLVLTDHPSQSSHVASYLGDGVINFPQTGNIAEVHQFVADGIAKNIPTAIAVTTNPERGKWWLDQLLSDENFSKILRENSGLISFVLPQSPNPFLRNFEETRCPVVLFDYYPGIGGVRHEEGGVARVVAGIKENTNYAVRNSAVSTNNLRAIINCLAGGREVNEFSDISQISLPTNAFLHTVGIVVHVAEELVKNGVIEASILEAKTAQEFFAKLGDKGVKEINSSLSGKGFYRQMPQVGPNVLMMEMGDIVCEIRQKLIRSGKMPHSSFDEIGADGIRNASHISNHLKGKYAKQYAAASGANPYSVSFGEFIRNNPPYQNPGIVFPTTRDGVIDINHRFFTEELPTLRGVRRQGLELGISEERMQVFADVIGFCERLRAGTRSPEAVRLMDRGVIRSRL